MYQGTKTTSFDTSCACLVILGIRPARPRYQSVGNVYTRQSTFLCSCVPRTLVVIRCDIGRVCPADPKVLVRRWPLGSLAQFSIGSNSRFGISSTPDVYAVF